MPALRDRTGERYGSLVVLHLAAPGRTTKHRLWTCRCDCGAIEQVLDLRLASKQPRSMVRACTACRSRPCAICGAPVSPSSTSVTCSTDCASEHRRRYDLQHYHEKRKTDPAAAEARRERARARWANATPEERERAAEAKARYKAKIGREGINEMARDSHARRMSDSPDYAERKRAASAAWAAAHPDEMRRFGREYRRRMRAMMAAQELGEANEIMREMDDGEAQD